MFKHFKKYINEWECYKYFIVDLSMINSTEDYKNLLSRDGKCQIVEASNCHVSAVCFLIICSECIMKIASMPFIKVEYIMYFVLRFVLPKMCKKLCKIYLKEI